MLSTCPVSIGTIRGLTVLRNGFSHHFWTSKEQFSALLQIFSRCYQTPNPNVYRKILSGNVSFRKPYVFVIVVHWANTWILLFEIIPPKCQNCTTRVPNFLGNAFFIFEHWANFLWPCVEKFLVGLSKLKSTCLKDGITFFRQFCRFLIFSDMGRKKTGLWKIFQLVRQNCILRDRKNLLRMNSLVWKIFCFHFPTMSEKFLWRKVLSVLPKMESTCPYEHFEHQRFFRNSSFFLSLLDGEQAICRFLANISQRVNGTQLYPSTGTFRVEMFLFKKVFIFAISSGRVSRSGGGWRSLCIKMGNSDPTQAKSREETSTQAERSRKTGSSFLIGWRIGWRNTRILMAAESKIRVYSPQCFKIGYSSAQCNEIGIVWLNVLRSGIVRFNVLR